MMEFKHHLENSLLQNKGNLTRVNVVSGASKNQQKRASEHQNNIDEYHCLRHQASKSHFGCDPIKIGLAFWPEIFKERSIGLILELNKKEFQLSSRHSRILKLVESLPENPHRNRPIIKEPAEILEDFPNPSPIAAKKGSNLSVFMLDSIKNLSEVASLNNLDVNSNQPLNSLSVSPSISPQFKSKRPEASFSEKNVVYELSHTFDSPMSRNRSNDFSQAMIKFKAMNSPSRTPDKLDRTFEEIFEGTWELGKGKIRFKDNSVYIGSIKNKKRDGFGNMYFDQAGSYKGQWKDDCIDGYGVLYFSNGSIAYKGNWAMAKFEGEGELYNDSPEEELGFDPKDLSLIGANWTSYKGLFKEDMKHGLGELNFLNGLRYLGTFEYDLPHGKGIFYNKDSEICRGNWKNGIFCNFEQKNSLFPNAISIIEF